MANAIPGPAGTQLQSLFETGTAAGLSDRELLERFLSRHGPGAEAGFAALVERHGPMVLRVCRDVLRDSADADDAFQATFLILSRRAAAIRRRESVGPWLYGVALRVARCALRRTARRRESERRGAAMRPAAEVAEIDRLDAAPLLHEEVRRLSEAHRAPVVLCYFEGLTHEQAAGQLGWPVGTVRSRLARARDMLRSRLIRRGLAPSAGFLAASVAAEGTSAVVPSALAAGTVWIAMRAAEAGA
ncbi:MAG TPA: sigma-70 family RNA polymerase sigma factor, partial [Isosphaeraceae bacterium]